MVSPGRRLRNTELECMRKTVSTNMYILYMMLMHEMFFVLSNFKKFHAELLYSWTKNLANLSMQPEVIQIFILI